ncbi:hypothetical protein MLD38_027446 [Melastoma candidum]|uniref:Uncharacterized protein n=1 Tax=Melastoma candidum TaxID=119954 RepID=A0ACB9P1S7_9MYRT|nr:hypothetical protein MLD38_027446 [Melastoma candidum]
MEDKEASPLYSHQDQRSRSRMGSCLAAASLLFLGLFLGSAFFASDYRETYMGALHLSSSPKDDRCQSKCRPSGSEALPEGIVVTNSNLEMRPLWGFPEKTHLRSYLFGAAVGIKQKDLIDKMVTTFLRSNFTVMLFHYDGVVDDWKDLEWSERVIHVSALSQTKWWFAKRFLHPEIVAEYDYIFLWDEDLGVEYFHPDRYISIIKDEGLEISQPALDIGKSEVHHLITARVRRSTVHRRTYKLGGAGRGCDSNSTGPPCAGWIEMMAPVFSRAAWRCVWHMIQNDFIHAWGLDILLGYCAQGDRLRNVGIVDAEYIIHYNRPTLGVRSPGKPANDLIARSTLAPAAPPMSGMDDPRIRVRYQSYAELDMFNKRWKMAAEEDKCWSDPYPPTAK